MGIKKKHDPYESMAKHLDEIMAKEAVEKYRKAYPQLVDFMSQTKTWHHSQSSGQSNTSSGRGLPAQSQIPEIGDTVGCTDRGCSMYGGNGLILDFNFDPNTGQKIYKIDFQIAVAFLDESQFKIISKGLTQASSASISPKYQVGGRLRCVDLFSPHYNACGQVKNITWDNVRCVHWYEMEFGGGVSSSTAIFEEKHVEHLGASFTQSPPQWKFKVGDRVAFNTGRYRGQTGTIDQVNTVLGQVSTYHVAMDAGGYTAVGVINEHCLDLLMPNTGVNSMGISVGYDVEGDELRMTSMSRVHRGGNCCSNPHNVKVYDSGFTRYEYCSVCDKKVGG